MASETNDSGKIFFTNIVVWRWVWNMFWCEYMWSSIQFCSVSQKQLSDGKEAFCDTILRKENPFLTHQHSKDSESEDEVACRLPDLEKDDFAARRARMNQTKTTVPLSQLLYGPYPKQQTEKSDGSRHRSVGNTGEESLEYKRCVCVCRKRESIAKQMWSLWWQTPFFPTKITHC